MLLPVLCLPFVYAIGYLGVNWKVTFQSAFQTVGVCVFVSVTSSTSIVLIDVSFPIHEQVMAQIPQ